VQFIEKLAGMAPVMNRRADYLDPSAPEFAADVVDEIQLVLVASGHEAGQYCVLGPDPWQVIWNDDRSGFVSFLEGRRCLLVWRSPVGNKEMQVDLLARLAKHASRLKKSVFAMEVNKTTCDAGVQLGMFPIWTGTESYIDLDTWSLRGGKRKKIRWARSHALALGIEWREAFPFSDIHDRVGITRVEELWKAERPERRTNSFLRTSFEELADLRRYFVAEEHGEIIAFVTCTPVNEEGWYLQDIVRAGDAPRGALEGAMAHAIDTFQKDGYRFVSNGALPFWRPDEQWSDPNQFGVVGNQVLRFFNRQYRFRGINQFRSKLEPDRVTSLYVLRSRRVISPRVGWSLIKLLNRKMPTTSDSFSWVSREAPSRRGDRRPHES
jgi:lysylphosphatidylglycerol synthetase-like protein (DUF2156 family)